MNINLVSHGLVVELQVHLAEVLRVADKQHVAYEAARELDLMGVLEKPETACLSAAAAAPAATTITYNVARLVIALLSLFIAVLYLDGFTLKGLRLLVRRADPDTWRGFSRPYVVHRVYGIALAAPYLANVYMLMRAAGLFGQAAKDARRERTRIGLLYERYFGYEGSHFVWKVFCFQIVEVALQAAGKIPLFGIYLGSEGGNLAFWFVYVFILALVVNVLYPPLLLRSRLVLRQRDVAYGADTFLDIVYALTPFVFLLSGIRSQAMLIPHEPVAYVSNLVPLMHAHFVIATLETAGERARAPKPVAPSDNALQDDDDEPPAPLNTPAGRRYRGLVVLLLGVWTLAMGCFYSDKSPLHWFVRGAMKKHITCQYEEDGAERRWTEWGPKEPNARNITWTELVPGTAARTCAVDDRLENIEPGAFVGLGSLESLKLQKENTIQYAEGTTSKLQSDHNALTVLKNGTFAGLDALSGTLDLSLYGIQSIEPGAFLGMHNLKILLLQSNDLTVLQADTFIGLENLNEVHLGDNYLSLETIEPGAFAGLDNLEGILFLDEMCDSLRATDELPPSATCW